MSLLAEVRRAYTRGQETDREAFQALAREVHGGTLTNPSAVAERLAELGAAPEDLEAELAWLAGSTPEQRELVAAAQAVAARPAASAQRQAEQRTLERVDVVLRAVQRAYPDEATKLGLLFESRRAMAAIALNTSPAVAELLAAGDALHRWEHKLASPEVRERLVELARRRSDLERRVTEAARAAKLGGDGRAPARAIEAAKVRLAEEQERFQVEAHADPRHVRDAERALARAEAVAADVHALERLRREQAEAERARADLLVGSLADALLAALPGEADLAARVREVAGDLLARPTPEPVTVEAVLARKIGADLLAGKHDSLERWLVRAR